MINNFDLIRPLLTFDTPGSFYFVQIFKRRKDNPGMKKDMIVLDNLFLHSADKYNESFDRIATLCHAENARAYIRLNVRNTKKVAMQMLKLTTELIISENYKPLKGVYTSACGDCDSSEDKTWIVDLDTKDKCYVESVIALIGTLPPLDKEKLVAQIPSKNGYHLITRPFHLQRFRAIFPSIDVHKDNPTLLYAP
jgi:hypothetical protein